MTRGRIFFPTQPNAGALRSERSPCGCKSAVGTAFPTNINPQKGIHEMSYLNTQALIESLLNLMKILARNPDRRLRSSTRAP